jgi:hypothetical protein
MPRIEPLEKYNELSKFQLHESIITADSMQTLPYLWIKQSNYVKFQVQPNNCTTMPLEATFDQMTQSGWAATSAPLHT